MKTLAPFALATLSLMIAACSSADSDSGPSEPSQDPQIEVEGNVAPQRNPIGPGFIE
ncbi:MAG: hypothetical protein IPG50_30660 [Myxococcales bacterium]|nr:hypothetical protein [Myxococcales bacterium]